MTRLYPLLTVVLAQLSEQLDIENCREELSLGDLTDDAFSASSSYDPLNVGPQNARLHSDENGGAWCPREPVSPEKSDQWLGMNLSSNHVISELLTQGRYAHGQGQEYALAYRLQYWREGMHKFREYRDSLGRTILPGNMDTFTLATNVLNPPIVASAIRILPYSNHSRTVCLRAGLRGCQFAEAIESYNIPQGMVRGATLELLDITYDGVEDPVTGFLRGGLGQLVDGKYGSENFRALGENGIVRGYEWVGWKNKSMGPLQMDFTFKEIRKFEKLSIHINNHYTRDIQIFSRAKIYFSNEEGKFGDDRAVDFLYMTDAMVEDARNVSINLHGEHGKYVMIQLFFAAKWMLISEITFISESYEEKPFVIEPADSEQKNNSTPQPMLSTSSSTSSEYGQGEQSSIRTVFKSDEEESQSEYVGLVIGILLTMISLLLAGIFFVIYRGRRGKDTPTHSLLAAKIQDKITASIDFQDLTAPYKAKMRVYGQVSATEDDCNLYANPVSNTAYTARFPSLHKKFSSDPVLSDCTDDYAEPNINLGQTQLTSASISDNIYSHVVPLHQINIPSNPTNHYSKPLSPLPQLDRKPFLQYSSLNQCSPPQRHSPPHTLNLPHTYQDSSWQTKDKQFLHFSEIISPSPSSSSSLDRLHTVTNMSEYQFSKSTQPQYSKVKKSHKNKSFEKRQDESVEKPKKNISLSKLSQAKPRVVKKSQLRIVEKIGAGQFGEVHLCHFLGSSSSALVAVKSLDGGCTSETRSNFEAESKILSAIDDPHIARVLGVNLDEDPWFSVREYSDQGDLTQYLQDHVAESSLSKTPGITTLSYGALIYMATQIASGMKCLESINFVHRDLATRNCLVYPRYSIKISDCGSAKPVYSCDYYRPDEGQEQLPIRWMAWESVLLGVYTTKSDVWSFGVTFWEILTFAREQPYEALSDHKVIENLSELYEHESLLDHLPQPYNCPRDVFELISECWHRNEEDRPNWAEIILFLQRKNLGFNTEEN